MMLEKKQTQANEQDPKIYIKRNMEAISASNQEVQVKMCNEQQQQRASRQGHRQGAVPKYLQKFKAEAEKERQDTVEQIKLNKRP